MLDDLVLRMSLTVRRTTLASSGAATRSRALAHSAPVAENPGMFDVVIAGGGIGGAVLAALLVRGGLRVTVIERAKGPPPFLRPEILWPPAVATLCSLRPREFWERECFRALGGITMFRKGRAIPFLTPAIISRAGAQPFINQPNNTRETLLAICGAEVRRGVEVLGVLRDGARVCGLRAREIATGVEFEIEAALTVGDDGPHSKVREGCGIPLELRRFPVEFLVRALPWPEGWPDDVVRLWPARRNAAGLLGFGMMPMPGGSAAALALVRGGQSDAALEEAWAGLSGDEELAAVRECGFPHGFTRIHRDWGHAGGYGCAGAVLIGDAIHPVSPAGGQGANMAIADADALARLILAGTPDIAAALENERRPFNERGIRPTRLASRAMSGTLPGALARLALPLFLSSAALRVRALRVLANMAAAVPR